MKKWFGRTNFWFGWIEFLGAIWLWVGTKRRIGQFWQNMAILERYLANKKCDMVANLKCIGLRGLHDQNGPWHLYINRSLLGLSTFLIFFCFRRVYEGHFMLWYWGTAVSAVWLELCCFFSRISYLSFIVARYFFRETAVVLLQERTLWFAGWYLSTSRVGFSTVHRRSNYIWRSSVRMPYWQD